MQEIIAHLEKVLHEVQPFDKEKFIEAVDRDSHLHWKAAFPVAVVHHKARMSPRTESYLQEQDMLDLQGYSRESYDADRLKTLTQEAPDAFKQVSVLVVDAESDTYTYRPKRPGDKWKKVVNSGSFKAVVEVSEYGEDADVCKMESELRDLMRSSKEIPSLKEIGFVWVVVAPEQSGVEKILKHYFGDNYLCAECGQRNAYIGWGEKLGEINMRYFVCPPNKEKR
ncbi:MAG: hypothetical protein L3J47_05500 [Sulfurovum sp.]|nr:hypothetical protein [Sulfurovum sp.]